jgi:predicted secreted Zn-dependent protease
LRSLLVAALLLPPALFWGEALALEKCVAPDGSVSYVDRCPAGTTRAPSITDQRAPQTHQGTEIIRPDPLKGFTPVPEPRAEKAPTPAQAPAAAGLHVSFYDIQAHSHESLVRALDAHRPHARSSWTFAYEYKPGLVGSRCRVGTVTTQLRMEMTLPRWTPSAGADPALVERWQRFVEALRLHEDRRLDHARALENAIGPALASLPLASDCKALDAAARARYEALLGEARAHDQDYEARAQRGETGLPIFK